MSASMNGDAAQVGTFLMGARSRLRLLAFAKGASVGFAVAAAMIVAFGLNANGVSIPATIAIALGILGAAVGGYLSAQRSGRTALLVEQQAPECNNLIVTAYQLMAQPDGATVVAPVVFSQAARAVRKLDIASLFPAGRSIAMLGVSAAMLTVALLFGNTQSSAVSRFASSSSSTNAALGIQRIDATVIAPAYAARATQTVRDPARIEALVGSHVKLVVTSNAASLIVETLQGKQSLTPSSSETFNVDVIADVDGFIALQPASANSALGTRRLIGLSVTPDAAPHVRIVVPAKDMMFPDANRSLDISIEADDDIALASLKLKFTQVSGSGERYTFKEGELPLQISRTGEKLWSAKAHWNLATLGLDAGDMVVYRAAAADKRPGAIATESDSYIAEILTPGSDAAAGFSIDPDQERYALSQQMIIVKTERLTAKKATLSSQAFADEANDIAVEQRRVRAEFVFMMGGELADNPAPDEDMTTLHEEAEAEGESDILAGRNANSGRVALQQAIRSMSAAATFLNVANVTDALEREKTALKQVERAFSHTRIILRALTEVEKLDLTRRMTGPLLETGRDAHPSANPDESVRVVSLRSVLAGVAELSGSATAPGDASARASGLAEQALRIGASEKPLQEIASQLTDAANAFAKRSQATAQQSLNMAAIKLTAAIRAEVIVAPVRSRSLQSDKLNGALVDLSRGARGSK